MPNNNDISEEELKNENFHPRAQYHVLDDAEKERKVTLLRWTFSEMYKCMDEILGQNRESSLAYTKLEEAQMWAIKSISHNN